MSTIQGKQIAELKGELVTTEKPEKPYDAFRNSLNAQKGEFVKVLPSHISFERFQRTIMTAILQNNDLLHANRSSLLSACIKAATDGLLPDGRDAALVIFNASKKIDGKFQSVKMVQYLPMYSGILKKVRQSGELSSVETHIVYEKDTFLYVLGDGAKIEHTPYLGAEDRGAILAAYCIVKLKDGTLVREVMTRGDIEKVRLSSKAGAANEYDVKDKKAAKVGDPKGIWAAWYEEMARKTVFRRCAKWLPQNVELVDHVFENDHTMEVMGQVEGGKAEPLTIDVTASEEPGEEHPEEQKQPDLKAEVTAKKPALKEKIAAAEAKLNLQPLCKNCAGKGVVEWQENGQEGTGPCPDCKGEGKV